MPDEALAKKHPESYWQEFFQANPFALHLVFGYPLIQIQGQVYVGGTKFAGSGGRFTDFLAKNELTGNIAIFEIKKPTSKLVNKSKYRNSIYPPDAELTGAVGQILDQRIALTRSLALLKEESRMFDIHAYSIRCCIIIGRLPDSEDQRKTLEAYRGNSSTVDIVTYDELLAKLRQLRDVLRGSTSL